MRPSMSIRAVMLASCACLAGGCGFYGDGAMLVTGQVTHADGSLAGLCALQLIDGESNAVLDGRSIDGSRFLEDFTISPRSGSFRVEVQCGASSGASRQFPLDEAKGGSVTIDLGTIVVTREDPAAQRQLLVTLDNDRHPGEGRGPAFAFGSVLERGLGPGLRRDDSQVLLA